MAEVDDVWAEIIRHLPMSNGAPDETREKVEFVALLRTGDQEPRRPHFGRGNKGRAGVTADGGTLRIDRSANPDLEIRKDDRIVALERGGEPAFEILSVDDRSHLRLICELGDIG